MTVIDREIKLMSEVRDLVDFYHEASIRSEITLFADDYDFLFKRKRILGSDNTGYTLGGTRVKRGFGRKKARRKRPPDLLDV